MSARRTFDSAGVPIRFTDAGGTGEPVVFIHGLTGSLENWTEVTALLSGRFRAIALDCRGHGASGKPHDASAYGLEMVADVVRLLDALAVESAHLVGYSMGAEIALRLTTREPARVRSLCIGGSGWSGPRDEANYSALAKTLGQGQRPGALLQELQPEGSPRPTEEEIAAVDALFANHDAKALAGVALGMPEIIGLPREAVAGIRVPVLGIAGEHDPERGNLERMAGVVPDFTLRVLDGVDHVQAANDPRLAEAIVAFLRQRLE